MDKDQSGQTEPNVIEGADAGAIGTGPPPQSAPPGAEVDDAEHRVPGADGDDLPTGSKPWFTSLADAGDQAGVANDDPDAQEPPVYERPEDPPR